MAISWYNVRILTQYQEIATGCALAMTCWAEPGLLE